MVPFSTRLPSTSTPSKPPPGIRLLSAGLLRTFHPSWSTLRGRGGLGREARGGEKVSGEAGGRSGQGGRNENLYYTIVLCWAWYPRQGSGGCFYRGRSAVKPSASLNFTLAAADKPLSKYKHRQRKREYESFVGKTKKTGGCCAGFFIEPVRKKTEIDKKKKKVCGHPPRRRPPAGPGERGGASCFRASVEQTANRADHHRRHRHRQPDHHNRRLHHHRSAN